MGLVKLLVEGGAIAILGFAVLFLIGAIPLAPHPHAAVIKSIELHDTHVLESTKILRSICYRLPDNPRFPCE